MSRVDCMRAHTDVNTDYDPEFGMGDHMFTDLTLSRELMTGFLEGEERRGDTSRLQKMNVMVLQRSAWPFAARKTDIDLPRWVCLIVSHF